MLGGTKILPHAFRSWVGRVHNSVGSGGGAARTVRATAAAVGPGGGGAARTVGVTDAAVGPGGGAARTVRATYHALFEVG